jgi:hypothetical protein
MQNPSVTYHVKKYVRMKLNGLGKSDKSPLDEVLVVHQKTATWWVLVQWLAKVILLQQNAKLLKLKQLQAAVVLSIYVYVNVAWHNKYDQMFWLGLLHDS